MKCLFLDYVHYWWSAWLIDELKPHLPPLSYQKNEMLNFWLHSTSDDQPGWSMDLNPICHASPAKNMKCSFLDFVQLLMISQAGQWLEPHLPPLSSQKSEMLIFVLQSTSDLGQTGQWTRTPSTTRLQPIKWNVWFWITLNFWWLAGLVEGLEPHQPSLSSLKHEMLVFVLHSTSDVGQAAQWTQTPSATLSSQKNEILIFGLCSTSDDQPGWSMDLNPICHPSPPKKVKWSFLDYIQLLMIGRAGWWTQTPSTTTLQSKNEILIFGLRSTSDDQPGWSMDSNPICHPSFAKKWNAHFWIMFNFRLLAWQVDGLKPHLPALSN